MICFYHSADLDGHCSGAIVKRAIPEIDLRPIDYGDEFPWDDVDGENVILVDFSLQPYSDMLRLRDTAKSVIWIDHHESAIKEAVDDAWLGKQEIGKAGCELTWEHFFPCEEMPDGVRLLGRYDVWDLEYSDDVLPYQWGMRMERTDPESPLWILAFSSIPSFDANVVASGQLILHYKRIENEKICRTTAFETEIDGLKVIASNNPLCNSQMFDSVWDSEKYHAMCSFYRKKKGFWTVSLYSTREDVDVSVTCKGRGGGGHKNAAGFQCEPLIKELS